jgi:hypothetical protein
MSGTGLANIAPETPIAALGLDSLQRVELVAALKELRAPLPIRLHQAAT